MIGPFPDFKYRTAVDKAVEVSAKVRGGIDPRLEAKERAAATEEALDREKLTVGLAFRDYCAEARDPRSSTQKDRERGKTMLETGALWRLPLFDVKAADLVREFNSKACSEEQICSQRGIDAG